MKKFSQLILLSLLGILIAGFNAYGSIRTTASSVQEHHTPERAIDGDRSTRWSSEFADNQWLKLDLGRIETVSGLAIHWEAAYASHYKIFLSKDGEDWINVYEMEMGDGYTDQIYFSPQETRFIKIDCVERATGWGNSIWEIEIKYEEYYPLIETSSYIEGHPPSNIMDGNFDSFWSPDKSAPQSIIIDLKEEKGLGGFQLFWGENYAKSYEILISQGKEDWRKVFETENSRGGIDFCYIDRSKARYIKIIAKESSQEGFSLREVLLKGPNEHLTAQRQYEVLAFESPEGFFPGWLYKKQVFWTVTGIQAGSEASIISSDGTIEPYEGSFTIMPHLYIDGQFITSNDCAVSQSLKDSYLPIPSVHWDYGELILNQKMFTADEDNTSTTFVIYELKNKTSARKEGSLYLTIRPIQLNPPWQHGRLPAIRSIEYVPDRRNPTVKINNEEALVLLEEPDGFGATSLNKGDIITYVFVDKLPEEKMAIDTEGLCSSAIRYSFNLRPNESKKFFFVLPLGRAKSIKEGFSRREIKSSLKETERYWRTKLSRFDIDIPQEELVNVMKANLAYLLINKDGSAIQPGSRNYARSWVRDSSVMSAALLRVGFYKEVRDYLDWVTRAQKPSGEMPPILESTGQITPFADTWTEWDGQGAYVFAVAEYYRFTKDKEFLEEKFPYVVKALKFLEDLRKQRLTDQYKGTYYYGILPESNSHEGYFPAMHSLWDDFWALKGWKDGQFIARVLGREDSVGWMREEEEGLRQNLLNNIKLNQERRNINYLPGCFEKADFDATSTAISVWPTQEAEYLGEDLLYTLEKYYASTFYPRLKEGLTESYTPYEMRTATAFLLLGHKEKTLSMVNYFLQDMVPDQWRHWAEVVHAPYERAQYIGDMPHSWIGGIYINLIRNLFVYEEEDLLHLAAGVDNNWFKSKNTISVKNLPTYYGDLNYRITAKEPAAGGFIRRLFRFGRKPEAESLRLRAWGEIEGASKIIFHIPSDKEVDYAVVDNRRVDRIEDNKIEFEKLPVKVTVYFKK
jgi:hypothetical protein